MLDLVVSSTLLALTALSLLWFGVLTGVARFAPAAKAGGSALMSGSIVEYYYWVVGPVVRFLVALGVSAHQVTGASLFLGISAGFSVALGHFGVAALLLIASSVCDGIDGQVARAHGTTSASGAVFDSAADRYNEIAIMTGLAFFLRNSVPLFLVTLLALTASLMVSYSSAKAESMQVKAPRGSMRRGERAMYLCLGIVLVPVAAAAFHVTVAPTNWSMIPVALALGIIALVGNLSAIFRFREVARAVDERDGTSDRPPALVAGEGVGPKRPKFALFRHQIAALAATSVDFVTMVALVELLAIAPSQATLIGASAGAGTNFVLGRKYTFPDSEGSVAGQLVRYTVVAGMSALLNAFGVWLLGRVGVPYAGARLATALVVSVAWNFPMHRAFVFAAPSEPAEEASGSGPIGARVRS
jgi:phosphatidylglycerophosphate synthase/putative flippase GtrA